MKNKHRLKTGMLLASLWIMLFRCHAAESWQPNFSESNEDQNPLWGAETNHVKVGLSIQYSSGTNHTLAGFYPMLINSSATNGNARADVLQLWLPPFDSRYRMELKDTNGNAVPKTAEGKVLGKPIDQPFKLYRGGFSTGINFAAGYDGQILIPDIPILIRNPFVLEDYFNITNAGEYHLKFEMQVLWVTKERKGSATISNLPTVWLPPVNAEIEIKNP